MMRQQLLKPQNQTVLEEVAEKKGHLPASIVNIEQNRAHT
jgi:hypothetical protein